MNRSVIPPGDIEGDLTCLSGVLLEIVHRALPPHLVGLRVCEAPEAE